MASAPTVSGQLTATDEAAWDAFVDVAPGGDLVQTSAWARSKRAVGLGTRLVLVRDERGAIAAGAHVIVKRIAPGVAAGSVARGRWRATPRPPRKS